MQIKITYSSFFFFFISYLLLFLFISFSCIFSSIFLLRNITQGSRKGKFTNYLIYFYHIYIYIIPCYGMLNMMKKEKYKIILLLRINIYIIPCYGMLNMMKKEKYKIILLLRINDDQDIKIISCMNIS